MKNRLLVLGSGMFVNGQNSETRGVILPSIYQFLNDNPHDFEIYLTYRSFEGKQHNLQCCEFLKINNLAKVNHLKSDFSPADIKNLAKSNKIDSAIISLPDHLHHATCKVLLECGVNTLVVKPFVLKLEDAVELTKLQEGSNIHGQIEFHKRLDYSNRYLKSEYQKGSIGDILKIDIRYSQNKRLPLNFFKSWSSYTNVFSYLGVHYVDLIYWITGYYPTRVSAFSSKYFIEKVNLEYSFDVIIEWELENKKFNSNFSINWCEMDSSQATSLQYFNTLGTNGRINLNQTDRGIHHIIENKGLKHINPYYVFEEIDNNKISYSGYGIDSVISFMKNITNKKTKYPSFRDGIISSAVIEAVEKSSKLNGESVKIFLDEKI
ncbi:Gfo/Idh/MocA family oxidoreductase [Flavobacteriaceae bacterium]|nr:Gfo/Idh/MocA family oxidoreductase [Flavobacteriaceae bacterium]